MTREMTGSVIVVTEHSPCGPVPVLAGVAVRDRAGWTVTEMWDPTTRSPGAGHGRGTRGRCTATICAPDATATGHGSCPASALDDAMAHLARTEDER